MTPTAIHACVNRFGEVRILGFAGYPSTECPTLGEPVGNRPLEHHRPERPFRSERALGAQRPQGDDGCDGNDRRDRRNRADWRNRSDGADRGDLGHAVAGSDATDCELELRIKVAVPNFQLDPACESAAAMFDC